MIFFVSFIQRQNPYWMVLKGLPWPPPNVGELASGKLLPIYFQKAQSETTSITSFIPPAALVRCS